MWYAMYGDNMARSENQKLSLLYLQDYLRKHTDEAHPASAQVLIAHLESKGLSVERKTLYRDIALLNDYGTEILYKRGKPNGYYVSKRDFELAELKFLVDAVLSSRFLSKSQSSSLIRKLAALSSTHESALLRREIVLAGRVKAQEEHSFAGLDVLHEAIAQNKQIRFRYFDWGIDLQKKFRDKTYTASPYALLWDDENYYLVAHSERHGLTHYRVDKMENICLTEQARILGEDYKKFDPASYAKETFGMFRGERQQLKLRFEASLAGVVADRFGRDIILIPDGDAHFIFTVNIALSPNFLGWLCSFGGRANIVFPDSAVETYRTFCQTVLASIDEK